jgi:type I restriction enzyme S subunit
MSFPRYPKYKPSGVEWLGDVPEEWEVKRLKHNVSLLTQKTDSRDHPIGLENIEGWSGRFIPTETVFEGDGIAFDVGDILFGKLRPYLAKAYLAKSSGEAVGDFHVMRPSISMDGRFVQYQILNREFISIVDGSTFGSKMPRASWDFVGGMPVTRPPLPEQTAIAEFLDRETGKIDELVAEQRRLMELLNEKRQAVISHAVTKGLNPHAPMKPSGIEWLGDVPEHWTVKSVRLIASVVRGASPRPAGDSRYFGGNAVPWITVAEITKDNLVDLTETETFLTEEGAKNSRLFLSGTVIYSNSGATLGIPKILRINGCANDGVVAFEKLSRDVLPQFLYQYLASITAVIRDEVKQGAGQPNLNTDIIKALRFGIPPLDEQRLIVQRIHELANSFDALTAEAQRAIDLLQERRTALISAAVTGQIDVRKPPKN